MKRELIFATSNTHKISEARAILGISFILKGLAEINLTSGIPETGKTFAENARQKATFVFQNIGQACFAEDSGLEVDALGGAPGIYSARYHQRLRSPLSNTALIIEQMKGCGNRSARFVSSVCYINQQGTFHFNGSCEGIISRSIRGESGFGYDPVFVPNGFQLTFAEMTSDQKNALSHRREALEKFADFLFE